MTKQSVARVVLSLVLTLALAVIVGGLSDAIFDEQLAFPDVTMQGRIVTFARVAASSLLPYGFAAIGEAAAPDVVIQDPASLPCTRPKPYDNPRSLRSAKIDVRQLSTNAIELTIKHAPISGVTGEQVAWQYRNLDKMVQDPRNGEMHSMYMLAHPTDHVFVNITSSPLVIVPNEPTKGTLMMQAAFFGTGCTSVYRPQGWTLSCPYLDKREAPKGYTCTSDPSTLRQVPSFKVSSFFFIRIDPQNVTMATFVGGRRVMLKSQSFEESKGQLHSTTKLVYGIDETWATMANPEFLKQIGATNTDGNFDKALPFLALRAIQEYGFYPKWLPDVYASNVNSNNAREVEARYA